MANASITNENQNKNNLARTVAREIDNGPGQVRENWGWIVAIGIALFVVGIVCLASPFISSLAVELVVAAMITATGVGTFIAAFFAKSWGGFFARAAIGVVNLVIGLLLLFNPLAGLISLTMLVATLLVMEGILRSAFAIQSRQHMRKWGWILASGVLTLLFGLIVAFQLPSAALLLIGVLVGLNMVFAGVAHVMIGLEARSLADPEAT